MSKAELLQRQYQVLDQINWCRTQPTTVLGQLQSWRSRFIDSKMYRHGKYFFKLREDVSILQDAEQYLKGQAPLSPLQIDFQLCEIACELAVALSSNLGVKSNRPAGLTVPALASARGLQIKVFGQVTAVLGAWQEVSQLASRILVEDGIPKQRNKRILFESRFRRLGVGVRVADKADKIVHSILVLLFTE